MTLVKIATRQSPLALWQANHVAKLLNQHHPEVHVELVKLVTQGDKILDTPLAKIGGKGLFVKELETGMLTGQADIAVHSMKDVPMSFPEGLALHTILEREDPRDAFVSNQYATLDDLPQNAVVGTSSLRRQCQIRAQRPDLVIKDLRGNVGTRLNKLDNGEYDAIILACAGLKRLDLSKRIAQALPHDICLPAVGQGVVGIETRTDDTAIHALLAPLEHSPTRICITAERALNTTLNGGCQVPIAGHATLDGDTVTLKALVGSVDGATRLYASASHPINEAHALGVAVAHQLLAQGADRILADVYGE